jgi:hypothetical protein
MLSLNRYLHMRRSWIFGSLEARVCTPSSRELCIVQRAEDIMHVTYLIVATVILNGARPTPYRFTSVLSLSLFVILQTSDRPRL